MTDDRARSEQSDLDEEIREFVEEMIDCLGWELDVDLGSAEGSRDEEDSVRVEMRGEDREIILRDRAEVLEVFQYLVNRIFGRELGSRRVIVDCDGFRRRKEAELTEIANRVSERVKLTGHQEELGLMNPYERRIVHLAVAEKDGVTTTSAGDGVMKRVIILPA